MAARFRASRNASHAYNPPFAVNPVGGFLQPIFFVRRDVSGILSQESDQPSVGALSGVGGIERTVTGLGFELVDVERSARGLLRIFIDRVPGRTYPEAQGAGEFVTVDDCEVVTRQLLYALEADGVAFERLEVSSPGLDRPLKKVADFERFLGEAVEITLKASFQGRKHWRGVLGRSGAAWSLRLDAGQAGKGAGAGRSRKGAAGANRAEGAGRAADDSCIEVDPPDSEMTFQLDEVREARLVPVIDFKGRGRSTARAAG